MPKENRESMKGEARTHKSSGSGTVRSIEGEKVGGKSGIRFPVHQHPDKSVVRGPKGA